MKSLNILEKQSDQGRCQDRLSNIDDIQQTEVIIEDIEQNKSMESPLLKRYLEKHTRNSGEKNNINENNIKIKDQLSSNTKINAGYYIEVPEGLNVEDPIIIDQSITRDKRIINEKNLIFVGENSSATIVLDYTGEENMVGLHNAVTELYIAENARVNIVKLQRGNDQTYSFDYNTAEVLDNGSVNWYSVEIGSSSSFSAYYTDLKGTGSQGYLSTIFFADGDNNYDFTYTMEHTGSHSISSIDSRGVLKDQASKIFRGKLKFNRGAVRASGSEKEDVLLLDPTVNSKVIPSLYCEEEDVSGQHAASAGKIKESQLYYLMSRGLTEIEAEKMLVEAALNPLIEKLPVTYIKEIAAEGIRERLYHGNKS